MLNEIIHGESLKSLAEPVSVNCCYQVIKSCIYEFFECGDEFLSLFLKNIKIDFIYIFYV